MRARSIGDHGVDRQILKIARHFIGTTCWYSEDDIPSMLKSVVSIYLIHVVGSGSP